MKKAIIFTVIALALVVSAVAVAVHYKHKHEDDVAYFALRAIHARAESVDCKAVADASYQEHCASGKDELRKYMETHTQAETLTEILDCGVRNFNRWTEAHDACYRDKETQQARDLEQWTEKYPRQAANLKRDALENARRRDAKAAAAVK